MKPMHDLRIAPDAEQLAVRAAELFVRITASAAGRTGRCNVALSGGSSPRRTHRLLATPPFVHQIPWTAMALFWVDERCVSPNHPASNFGAAREDVLQQVPLSSEAIHPIPVGEDPEAGALRYERILRAHFNLPAGQAPVFDLILLGIGKDGHTASLFPGAAALGERRRWVLAVTGGVPNVPRLTLTLPVINAARRVVFLVTGPEKAGIIQALLQGPQSGLPAKAVRPATGTVTWLLDRAAAAGLSAEARAQGAERIEQSA